MFYVRFFVRKYAAVYNLLRFAIPHKFANVLLTLILYEIHKVELFISITRVINSIEKRMSIYLVFGTNKEIYVCAIAFQSFFADI